MTDYLEFKRISPLRIVTLPREQLTTPGFPPPAKHKLLAIFCGLNEFIGTESQILSRFLDHVNYKFTEKFITYAGLFELNTIMSAMVINNIQPNEKDDLFFTRMRNPIILLELLHNQPYTSLKELCKLLNMNDIIYSPPTKFDSDPTECIEVGGKNNIIFNKICSNFLP